MSEHTKEPSTVSDIMLSIVIRMPYKMAMASEITKSQFYSRAEQALDERDRFEQQRDKALEFLKKALDAMSINDDEGLFEHVQPVMDMRAFIAEVEASK